MKIFASEKTASMMKKLGMKEGEALEHSWLNRTIATNMAGRGTDIVLGGRLPEETSDAEKLAWKEKHEAVISAGGLHIIGTERNESRRVDNQLRGRSGRQGDVGSTRFTCP